MKYTWIWCLCNFILIICLISSIGKIKVLESFVNYKNKVLTLRILGQCASCPFVGNTFDEGVKLTILNEIKEVKDVKFIY